MASLRICNSGTRRLIWPALSLLLLALPLPCFAATLIMRDGRLIEGSVGKIGGLAQNAFQMAQAGAAPAARPILVIDDDLRRYFVPAAQVAKIDETDAGEVLEKIVLKQMVAQVGSRIGRVGPILNVTDFDQWGRRTLTMAGPKGPINVVQGITTITPKWAKVEGIATVKSSPIIWDMRLATSSIPPATLSRIFSTIVDPKNLDQRLQLVRLYLQGERYSEAYKELELIIQDFPNEEGLKKEARALRQLTARRTIDEIEVRRKAGQHNFAYKLLDNFPSEDVAGETLQKVRGLVEEYNLAGKEYEQTLATLTNTVEAIKDSKLRDRAALVLAELKKELNINTFDRMAAYLRLAEDPSLRPEDKFSLAASGWLLGSDAASTNLIVTLSQFDARDLVRRFLAEPARNKRDEILGQLSAVEGASPKQIALILSHMKPAIETPLPEGQATTNYHRIEMPGFENEPNVVYHVQLPPEYDPYRQYPTVVTLHGSGTTATQQLDWWAGALGDNGQRQGQGSRLGYIVIAVEWMKEGQQKCDYSAREHHAVLASLRDAYRRFAIDTDRVFLSGHSGGGDAAWDIGLAHPDLWAGVIPIVAVVDRYCTLYWENAKNLPFYIVAGEKDGDRTQLNGPHIDRYMMHRYDVTVVEFQGRGHEHFSDEIQRIFDWMGRRERNFYPKEFEALTMRTWDNFFWWLEVEDFPTKSVVEPSDWNSKPAGFRPMELKGKIANNNVIISSGAKVVRVYLSPELVDFEKHISIRVGNKILNPGGKRLLEPSIEVMLDDVRTRGDRLHPFWAKVE